MQPGPACPRCGSSMPGEVCPRCAAYGPSSQTLIVSIIVGAILLLYLIYGGLWYRLIRRAKESGSPEPIVALHQGPIARSEQLTGSGHVYLVQMGPHKAPYALDDFAGWLRSKYALDVQVLRPMS